MTNSIRPKKIVITGPENSGKTTLASLLSKTMSWPLVEEMARVHWNGELDYDVRGLRRLCALQCHEERKVQNSAQNGLICDTNALTLFIWAWLKVGVHDVCDAGTIEQPDLYVLCYPDVPFEDDIQREDTGRRHMLFDLYLTTLLKRKLPFIIVRGNLHERLRYTITHINTL